ncbi:MAG: hypothetical protein Q4D81_00410 [Eubacteriales bacterium]|nr:hypothetical protein [Eubacteriales bacterium]
MTDDYIRREDALKGKKTGIFANISCFVSKPCVTVEYIESLEPADVAPVVRCDDCKYHGSRRWCELHSSVFDDNAFCSYGERREE